MGKNASGMYVIDADYNIVSYNHAAEIIYPELKKGEKCYRCLMHEENPCAECPVVNGIEGPKNYLKTKQKVLRSIDAVEIQLESGELGHAMIFSAAEATEETYRGITNNGENPLLLGIINVLGKDYSNIYSVNCATHEIQVFRFHNPVLGGVSESLIREEPYEKVVDIYIEDNVASEDKTRMRQMLDFDKICQRLKKVSQFMIHYRVRRDGITHYYYVKCARIGKADDFEAIVLSALEYDELTGLYIRQAFFHHAKTLMRVKNDQKFHVVVADVKNFKWINGTYGEKTGDQVLAYLGDAYKKQVHSGMVARYGGDQFVAIVYGDLNLAEEKVEAAIHRIAERAPISNLAVNYGIYENVDKTLPLTLICDRAFLAMKSIQNDYEHSFAFYDEEMGRKHIRDRMMENEFDEAIRNEEFVVYLQPKYNVVTEEIAGAEALVRWKKKDGSMVSPGEFIPLYEKDGLIVRLDEYVFNKVCEIQKTLMRSGKKLIPISVNLSRASIHYENMILRYVHIVEENGIPFFAVPIELTETAALYNVQIKELTEEMVNAGFELHMDDFGSGYSSMTSLNQLPFDTLKLDKSLIDYIENPRGKEVIRHTIALAHSLGMQVLAEGVETASQVKILRELDCDEIQGFYYSRPVPWEEFCTDFMGK